VGYGRYNIRQQILKSINLEQHPECKSLGLVIEIARELCEVWGGNPPGLEFEDLVQIGYLALVECHKDYDPTQGPRTRYIARAIRNVFRKAITEGKNLIRVPLTTIDAVRRKECGRRRGNTAEQVKRITESKKVELSLDLTTTKESSELLEAKDFANSRIPLLSERERKVIHQYFGLDEIPKTFREIGEGWAEKKLTRQAVQAIYRNAMEKLRDAEDPARTSDRETG
jgi:RNA polymerase sigma factor (sigma-70 family)